jgi:hypothetical protein
MEFTAVNWENAAHFAPSMQLPTEEPRGTPGMQARDIRAAPVHSDRTDAPAEQQHRQQRCTSAGDYEWQRYATHGQQVSAAAAGHLGSRRRPAATVPRQAMPCAPRQDLLPERLDARPVRQTVTPSVSALQSAATTADRSLHDGV